MRTNIRALVMLLPAAAFVVGCDDNSDDDPDLFVVSVNPGDQTTNVATGSNVVVRFSIHSAAQEQLASWPTATTATPS